MGDSIDVSAVFLIHHDKRRLLGIQQILFHVLVTVLAIVLAFSLPAIAQYVLYQWWPRVVEDANLLVATEVGLAVTLALLFNIAHVAWEDRQKVRAADLAALVYARHKRHWLDRWRERRLVRQLPATRDAYILTLTGFDTFARDDSLLCNILKAAYEIRVMLLNPFARSAEQRVDALRREVTLESFSGEVHASIAFLESLRTQGKKVTLRFYEQEPFWKVAVLDDHVWIQYCHSGVEIKHEPEYVFARNRDYPRQGLFVPFYMYFLDRWEDARNPEYDFATRELVYRDPLGSELRRAGFGGVSGREHRLPSVASAPREPAAGIRAGADFL
jgi:hypothetical protein